jgi:hypothetical protein
MPSFPTNAWNKGVLGKGSSRLTGIFPNAFMIGGMFTDNSPTITAPEPSDPQDASGVFIPFSDLTGVLNTSTSEIGNAATAAQNADAEDWSPAGGSRFMLGVLEAAFAAQQNATPAHRLANCVVTRSALSVVDEDTLQKTFTVKFKLNHTSQEVEAE